MDSKKNTQSRGKQEEKKKEQMGQTENKEQHGTGQHHQQLDEM